jgi:hypothetical protein
LESIVGSVDCYEGHRIELCRSDEIADPIWICDRANSVL